MIEVVKTRSRIKASHYGSDGNSPVKDDWILLFNGEVLFQGTKREMEIEKQRLERRPV
jgi:hypothetical protein